MATPPKDNEQPKKPGRKKAPAAAGPVEPFLTGAEPASGPVEEQPAQPTPDEIRDGAAKFSRLMRQLGFEDKQERRSRPRSEPREDREDVKRNRAKIRAVMVSYIKNEHRSPSVQEICEATGLSDKTVKAHKKHIKLGDGSANIYQQLSHDVIMAIFKKARGFTYTGERLLVVSQGKGEPSEVERHDQLMVVHPDMGAAKLWLQAIEGMSDKSETKHSGSVGGGSFHFEYVVPEGSGNE